MRISWGKTRFVFLFTNQAIKIGRVRPFRLMIRMVAFPFMSEGNHSRFFKRYGKFPGALWRYLIAGLLANRNEYEYYQDSRDHRVMPTIASFFGGWVIVQKRGASVSREDFSRSNPFQNYPSFVEVGQPRQFCWKNGRLVLVDYGRSETCAVLKQTLGSSPATF